MFVLRSQWFVSWSFPGLRLEARGGSYINPCTPSQAAGKAHRFLLMLGEILLLNPLFCFGEILLADWERHVEECWTIYNQPVPDTRAGFILKRDRFINLCNTEWTARWGGQ